MTDSTSIMYSEHTLFLIHSSIRRQGTSKWAIYHVNNILLFNSNISGCLATSAVAGECSTSTAAMAGDCLTSTAAVTGVCEKHISSDNGCSTRTSAVERDVCGEQQQWQDRNGPYIAHFIDTSISWYSLGNVMSITTYADDTQLCYLHHPVILTKLWINLKTAEGDEGWGRVVWVWKKQWVKVLIEMNQKLFTEFKNLLSFLIYFIWRFQR